jgi:hypothetical protein
MLLLVVNVVNIRLVQVLLIFINGFCLQKAWVLLCFYACNVDSSVARFTQLAIVPLFKVFIINGIDVVVTACL